MVLLMLMLLGAGLVVIGVIATIVQGMNWVREYWKEAALAGAGALVLVTAAATTNGAPPEATSEVLAAAHAQADELREQGREPIVMVVSEEQLEELREMAEETGLEAAPNDTPGDSLQVFLRPESLPESAPQGGLLGAFEQREQAKPATPGAPKSGLASALESHPSDDYDPDLDGY